MRKLPTRRDFAGMTVAAGFGITAWVSLSPQPASAADAPDVQTKFLFELALTTMPPSEIGSDRLVVAVSSGTFDGPRLKGTVAGPAGDWIVQRRDGSKLLDVRMLLQTDDGQRVYMTWRGIAYTPPGGALFARVLPMFETGSAKYAWLNNIVAVGIYRPAAGKIVYRIYEIL